MNASQAPPANFLEVGWSLAEDQNETMPVLDSPLMGLTNVPRKAWMRNIPNDATFIIMAFSSQFIISRSSSFWSRRHRYASTVKLNLLHLEQTIKRWQTKWFFLLQSKSQMQHQHQVEWRDSINCLPKFKWEHENGHAYVYNMHKKNHHRQYLCKQNHKLLKYRSIKHQIWKGWT